MSKMKPSDSLSAATSQEQVKQQIIDYYNHMDFFYENLWANKNSLGFHYGFWEDGIKNRHAAILNENRRISESLALNKSDIVLDAGCGVCGSSIWMAENYGCSVTGITLSEQQVRKAFGHIKRRKVEHLVNAEVMDYCNTTYQDKSFTKIFGMESVCCAFNKAAFAREAFRILKPGGRLVVADGFLMTHDMSPEKKKIVDEFCHGWGLPNCVTIDEFRQYLVQAGFVNVKIEDRTKSVLPSARTIWRLNVPFYLPLKVLCSLKILPPVYIEDTVSSIRQFDMFDKNIGNYAVFSADKP